MSAGEYVIPAGWGLGNYTSRELAGCLAHIERGLAVPLPDADRARLGARRKAVLAAQDERPLGETVAAVEAILEGLEPSHLARPAVQDRLRVLLGRKDKAAQGDDVPALGADALARFGLWWPIGLLLARSRPSPWSCCPVDPLLCAALNRWAVVSLASLGIRVDPDAAGDAAVAEAERVGRLADMMASGRAR